MIKFQDRYYCTGESKNPSHVTNTSVTLNNIAYIYLSMVKWIPTRSW